MGPSWEDDDETIIDQTYSPEISSIPSFSKRGIPLFSKGREGEISYLVFTLLWTD
jgi:hypothetical protein